MRKYLLISASIVALVSCIPQANAADCTKNSTSPNCRAKNDTPQKPPPVGPCTQNWCKNAGVSGSGGPNVGGGTDGGQGPRRPPPNQQSGGTYGGGTGDTYGPRRPPGNHGPVYDGGGVVKHFPNGNTGVYYPRGPVGDTYVPRRTGEVVYYPPPKRKKVIVVEEAPSYSSGVVVVRPGVYRRPSYPTGEVVYRRPSGGGPYLPPRQSTGSYGGNMQGNDGKWQQPAGSSASGGWQGPQGSVGYGGGGGR